MRTTIVIIMILLTGFSLNSRGQISGNKVIGTAPSDYLTFSDALNDLHSQGISGDVTFQVKAGTYTEHLFFQGISGLNASNNIIFESQSGTNTDVVLTYSPTGYATNYTVGFYNTSFITFQDMTLVSGGSSYANVIFIDSASTNLQFINTIIEGYVDASSFTSQALVISEAWDNDACAFDNNIFRYGSYAIYMYGTEGEEQGMSITNNQFIDQNFSAVYCSNCSQFTIQGNTINTTSINSGFRAIHIQYADSYFTITENTIDLPSVGSGHGIYITNSDASSGNYAIISNNFVHLDSDNSGADAVGINCLSSSYIKIIFNSVNITGTDDYSKAFVFDGYGSAGLVLRNNIAVNQAQGFSFFTFLEPPEFSSNYNNLYSNGTRLAYYTGDVTTLASWRSQTGQDANSQSVLPTFVSNSDLHLSSGSLANASPAYGTMYDVDHQLRDNLPDIGADEFDFTASVSDSESDNGIVSPNPSNGPFTIAFPEQLTLLRIDVYNIQGELVKQFSFEEDQLDVISLDLTGLLNGQYFLNITCKEKTFTQAIEKIN